jgi:hypothetical protein
MTKEPCAWWERSTGRAPADVRIVRAWRDTRRLKTGGGTLCICSMSPLCYASKPAFDCNAFRNRLQRSLRLLYRHRRETGRATVELYRSQNSSPRPGPETRSSRHGDCADEHDIHWVMGKQRRLRAGGLCLRQCQSQGRLKACESI